MLGVPTRVNTGLLRGLPATWDTEVALAPPLTEPATYSIPVGKVTVTSAVFLVVGNLILMVRVPISKLVLLAKCTSLWATALLTATCAFAPHDKHKKAIRSPLNVWEFSNCIKVLFH